VLMKYTYITVFICKYCNLEKFTRS
jgi:hypothetical protein